MGGPRRRRRAVAELRQHVRRHRTVPEAGIWATTAAPATHGIRPPTLAPVAPTVLGTMADRPRPPVMADVARRAGVSVMTVSRVLNGYPGVKAETKRRVELAIAALDYRANTAARTLAGGRSRILGVVAVEAPYFGPASALFGIEA